jgi:MGT family glycosyltransferase
MARMLAVTGPWEGHVNPLVPIVRELVRRGHDVRWYTGHAFRQKVEKTGAVYEPMRAGYDYSGMNREEAFPHHAGLTGAKGMAIGFKNAFLDTALGQMSDLLEIQQEFPADVLITDETCFGAGFVREHTGVPQIWIGTSIYLFSSRDTAPLGLGLRPSSSRLGRARNRLLRWAVNTVVLRELRRHGHIVRTQAGLPPLDRGAFENVQLPPDLYLMGTVPSFEYPRSDLVDNTHFVGLFLDELPERFDPPPWWPDLTGGRPVVHVTQGTISNDPKRLLLPTVRALATEDVLVIATTGIPPDRLRLEPLPRNVRLEQYIPYFHLLPHVDVMVTNGGYGGVNSALAHGVPIVLAATTEEKREIAARVTRAGAGVHMKHERGLEARLRVAVRNVLRNSDYRRCAQALRGEYEKYDGPRLAVDLIEKHVFSQSSR